MNHLVRQFASRWLCFVVLVAATSACQQTTTPNSTDAEPVSIDKLRPPVAQRKKHSFTHHGVTVRDDYNWLRDPGYPNVTNPKILDYLVAENDYYNAWLKPHENLVNGLFEELKSRQPSEDASVPYREGSYWYRWRFNPGAQYRVWYRAPVTAPDNWQVLLDENQLAQDHDYFRLGAWAVSPDGGTLVYSVDTTGAERYRIYMHDLRSDTRYDYKIVRSLGNLVWSNDSRSFLYVRLDESWRPFEVWRHRLRAIEGARGDDELVFREIDNLYRVGIRKTLSGQYVIIESSTHVTGETRVLPLNDELARPQLVAERRDGHLYTVDHQGEHFYILTNDTHPNYRLVRVPVQTPQPRHWQTVIAPSSQVYLTDIAAFANSVVVTQRTDGLDQVRILDRQHQGHLVQFPEAAYTVRLSDNYWYQSPVLRLHYESMVTPDTVFDYNLNQRRLHARKVQQVPGGYDPNNYVTSRVLATARDGVQVPVSIVQHKDYVADGSAPLWLYGYGAYGIAIPPSFSSTRLSALDRGFAFAIAHVRGGDDLGHAWYEAGKLTKRTNTFNDFVDVAKHLIDLGYGRAGRVVISGGSAGGELMGAVVNQAPELWGAVVANVPFVDVLNTMLDESLPLTPPEWAEWGNPIEDAEAFRYIRSYSPYDQLTPRQYPPILVTAGLNDPRVTYWEAAKYVAKLRHVKQGSSPALLSVDMGGGHGGKSGRFSALQEVAERLAFFMVSLNLVDEES